MMDYLPEKKLLHYRMDFETIELLLNDKKVLTPAMYTDQIIILLHKDFKMIEISLTPFVSRFEVIVILIHVFFSQCSLVRCCGP